MNIDIKLPRPHQNQQTILDSQAKYKVILAGRRFGKSLLSQITCITRMLKGQKTAYLTPTFDLARTFFSEFSKKLPHLKKKVEKSIISSKKKVKLNKYAK